MSGRKKKLWTEKEGVKENLYFSTMFSVPTKAILVRSDKPKFVEGSVNQLARVLYAIHEEHGAQPESAILEAIKTFGDDVDRKKKILNAARSSAEAEKLEISVRSLGKIGC